MELAGYRSLLTKTARALPFATEPASYKEAMENLDERWGDPAYWQVIRRNTSNVTPYYLLAAVDHQTGCVLSQCRVDQKTNEPKAALDLLQTLVLEGRVIVGDAIFCQREVCQQIIDSGGHYFLAVKGNQATLERDISLELSAPDGAFSPLHPAPAALGA